MSRVKGLITIALVVALLLNTGVALAGGPAGKVRGRVELGAPKAGWSAQFKVFEGTNSRPARGSMRIWNDAIEQKLDVKYVSFNSHMAWFGGECISDSLPSDDPDYKVGQWLFVKVVDGGNPPRKNTDFMGWAWYDTEGEVVQKVTGQVGVSMCEVIKGNLMVH